MITWFISHKNERACTGFTNTVRRRYPAACGLARLSAERTSGCTMTPGKSSHRMSLAPLDFARTRERAKVDKADTRPGDANCRTRYRTRTSNLAPHLSCPRRACNDTPKCPVALRPREMTAQDNQRRIASQSSCLRNRVTLSPSTAAQHADSPTTGPTKSKNPAPRSTIPRRISMKYVTGIRNDSP
jgi:hypothetical protein